MKNKLDKIVVVDVESTCWISREEQPKGEQSDIIEIGICTLDIHSGNIENPQGIIIKPARSRVSKFCTELTTLTQQDVDKGVSFAAAINKISKEYNTKTKPWASYGNYDRNFIDKQCNTYNVAYPFGPTHINVKNLAAIMNDMDFEVGMDKMLNIFDLTLEGHHHSGKDDAFNIAKILKELIFA